MESETKATKYLRMIFEIYGCLMVGHPDRAKLMLAIQQVPKP